MSDQKWLQRMVGVTLVALLLAGCGAPATTSTSAPPTPTLAPVPLTATPTPVPPTPIPTPIPPTPTSTPSPDPKAGPWAGEPSVSFYVGSDGNIHNFKIVIPIGVNTCTITLKEIVIQADGTFIFGEIDSDGTLTTNSISGKFHGATTLTGAYSKTIVCGGTFSISSKEGTWSAEWRGP